MKKFLIFLLPAVILLSQSITNDIEKKWSVLKTFSATLEVKKAKTSKLSQMDPDYKYLFNARKTDIYYRAPHSLRIEGTPYGLLRVVYIVNGGSYSVWVPGIGYKKEDNFKSVDKRTLSLDFGIIGPDFWENYTLKVVQQSKTSIQLEAIPKDSERKRMLWLNPADLSLQKSVKYNSLGKVRVIYVFENHFKHSSGVTIPRKIKMFSPDGELVAEGEFKNIKINASLPPDLFSSP